MIRAGMDVARINFSHGEYETHARNIRTIRRIAEEEDAVVAILADLQGPKIRLGKIANEPVTLKKGDRLTLTTRPADGTDMVFPLPHPEFVKDVKAGHRLLLDDGQLEFKVISKQLDDLYCEVVVGGPLSSRKGVSAPESHLTLCANCAGCAATWKATPRSSPRSKRKKRWMLSRMCWKPRMALWWPAATWA